MVNMMHRDIMWILCILQSHGPESKMSDAGMIDEKATHWIKIKKET